MTRPKNPIAIEPNMRYFYAHMAYQMGLTKYDGLEPVDGFNMNAVKMCIRDSNIAYQWSGFV